MISTTVHNRTKQIIKSFVKTALISLFWLGLWQLLYYIVDNDIFLASPIQVFKKLGEFLPSKIFWFTLLNSFKNVALGYILGATLGIVFGTITAFSSILRSLLKPFLTTVKTTPVVSFIILALVWIPQTRVPIFISSLMVMPIVWANTTLGIESTDKNLIEMANSYNFGLNKKIKNIYLPTAIPSVFSACSTAVGLGWKAGIAAEVLAYPNNSIGIKLKESQIYLETADLFAWTFIVIILSLILEKVLTSFFNFTLNKIKEKGGYFIENTNK